MQSGLNLWTYANNPMIHFWIPCHGINEAQIDKKTIFNTLWIFQGGLLIVNI